MIVWLLMNQTCSPSPAPSATMSLTTPPSSMNCELHTCAIFAQMYTSRKMAKTPPAGRPAQRLRTRKAIVAAAADLLARGATPSVGAVASAAEVSRRTGYMYFPPLEQLLIDASLA